MTPAKKDRLSWSNTKGFRKEYQIRENSDIITQLHRKSIFSGNGTFEIGNDSYVLESTGGVNRTITISRSSGERVGGIDLTWYGVNNGELRLESGDRYTWKCVDFLRGQWAWFNNDGHEIMTFRPEDLVNNSGLIDLSLGKAEAAHSDVLAVLGLHLKLFFNYWILTIAFIIIVLIIRR